MGYCYKELKNCGNANEYGVCQLTACVYRNTQYVSVQETLTREKYTRECEICGRPTDSSEYHLCPKCRLKLHDLLYNDDNWGKGNWA